MFICNISLKGSGAKKNDVPNKKIQYNPRVNVNPTILSGEGGRLALILNSRKNFLEKKYSLFSRSWRPPNHSLFTVSLFRGSNTTAMKLGVSFARGASYPFGSVLGLSEARAYWGILGVCEKQGPRANGALCVISSVEQILRVRMGGGFKGEPRLTHT